MALFNFGGKKEERKTPTCCCGSAPKTEETTACCCGSSPKAVRSVKVLGAGCKTCHRQYENVKAAVITMGLDVEVEYITDLEKVMDYGVMSMPAIVVNEKVVSMGRVLSAAEAEALLRRQDV